MQLKKVSFCNYPPTPTPSLVDFFLSVFVYFLANKKNGLVIYEDASFCNNHSQFNIESTFRIIVWDYNFPLFFFPLESEQNQKKRFFKLLSASLVWLENPSTLYNTVTFTTIRESTPP